MTRRPRLVGCIVSLPLLVAAAGCSVPVTIPLAPFSGATGNGDAAPVVTGSIGARVEERGVVEKLGHEMWMGMRPAVARAVEYGEDGETFAWRSLAGESGSVVPVAAYFGEAGVTCRRLSIAAESGADRRALVVEACREEGDLWWVRPAAEQA